MKNDRVLIVGAGLAGCEVALTLARFGIYVDLIEMKPKKFTPAHKNCGFAELVCSNSFKSQRITTASGLLKEEMRILGSSIMEAADRTKIPAGDALAVNRDEFSKHITDLIRQNPLIDVIEREQICLPNDNQICVIATGPLTSKDLAQAIEAKFNKENLSFFDAAAPIVTAESLNYDKVFFAARYGRGGADYANCSLNKQEYDAFIEALVSAETVQLPAFEQEAFKVFSGCQPIEVMAKQGCDTLRFGPLKPVGITNPKIQGRPYAVVQLRKEDAQGSLFNLVGFQTNLKWSEQKRVFGLIPGLENAEFIRFGVMHRNTFINSPNLLDEFFRCRQNKKLFFAGQITGVEGYLESAASGLLVAHYVAKMIASKEVSAVPRTTMMGSLAAYISDETNAKNFQPMNSNMGILPSLEERIKKKTLRYEALSQRSINDILRWKKEIEL